MENVRSSDNQIGGNSASAADTSGNSNADGSSVRADARESRQTLNGNANGESGAFKLSDESSNRAIGNTGVEITSGYYYTPNGRIERIPIGYYIDGTGRLRKQRKQRCDSSNANGDSRPDRSSTDQHEENIFTEDSIRIDKPLNIRGGKRGRKPKSAKEETSKMTMVTMLSTGCVAIFTSLAMLTKHEHWNLERVEAKTLAEALNDAIATLPEKYYAQITGIVETWIPWINLCFVAGAIIIPRIEASTKRLEETHRNKSQTTDKRDATTTDNRFDSGSSIGWHN